MEGDAMKNPKIYRCKISLTLHVMICLGTIILLCTPLAAQVDKSATNVGDKPATQPDIKFEQKVYDFGTIQKGEQVTHVFNFENAGQAVLKIEQVKTSCGCTVPKNYTKETPPGGKGQIEATFNSSNFLGAIHKTIYVKSNDPDEPTVNLGIKGTIITDLMVTPQQPLRFDVVEQGQSATKSLMIKQTGTDELKIINVESDNPFITTKIIPEPAGNRNNYKLDVTISPNAPAGVFHGTLKIYTNLEKHKLIQHNVMGIIKSKKSPAKTD
jgi:hypothetical protein